MTAAATARPVPTGGPERLETLVQGGRIGGFRAVSEAAACLMPLLNALGWRDTPRHLAEALPHIADTLDIDDLHRVLENLGYACRLIRTPLDKLETRHLPCLFVPEQGPLLVVLDREGDSFTVFDGSSSSVAAIDGRSFRGTATIPRKADAAENEGAGTERSWIWRTAKRFRAQAAQLLAITFVTNILALTMPLFIMAVYDRVIGAHSHETLVYLVGGAVFALLCDLALRLIRARLLAYVGARIDMIMGTTAFQRVLFLPVAMTERASVGGQLSRLKQFESVREFFTGPLANVFLDLPFAGIFLIAIAILGGPLAFVPLALMAVLLLERLGVL